MILTLKKILIGTLLYSVFFTLPSYARLNESGDYVLSKTKNVSCESSKDPKWEDILSIVENDLKDKSQLQVEDVLQVLKNKFPQYFENYVAVYQSRSLQGPHLSDSQEASFKNPRVILVGETARMLISFNGLENQARYHSLEMIRLGCDQKEPELRDFCFDKTKCSSPQIEIEKTIKNLNISKANPTKCYQCHGEKNLRWNWDAFSLWPGVYGSDADRLFSGTEHAKSPSSALPRPKNDEPETQHWSTFQDYKNENSRYKFLPDRKAVASLTPDEQQKLETKELLTPNLRFNQLLQYLNGLRVSHVIETDPRLNGYKLELVSFLLCGFYYADIIELDGAEREYYSMVDSAIMALWGSRQSFVNHIQTIEQKNYKSKESRINRQIRIFNPEGYGLPKKDRYVLADIPKTRLNFQLHLGSFYALVEKLGFPVRDLTLTLDRESYDEWSGSEAPFVWSHSLARLIKADAPSVASYLESLDPSELLEQAPPELDKACATLKSKLDKKYSHH